MAIRWDPQERDGITIWHSAYGAITHNQGGGNGENTIDVKDSHDVAISDNLVDAPKSTYNVRVAGNHCLRGGQGGDLSAGIALLFAQKSGVEENIVESAFGSGILIKGANPHPGNWA
jgi:nitrous oxidase accessory protein NosD